MTTFKSDWNLANTIGRGRGEILYLYNAHTNLHYTFSFEMLLLTDYKYTWQVSTKLIAMLGHAAACTMQLLELSFPARCA